MDPSRKEELLQSVAAYLEDELRSRSGDEAFESLVATVPEVADDPWLKARALMNIRPPWPASDDFLANQNELLQGLIAEAGVATLADTAQSRVDPRIFLWRGDITTLAVDAIVNAANSRLTGCWAPLHYCIDNAIHSYAGVQLRAECAALMDQQGHPEPTAQAKATVAYNLPCRWVIHTVGPIANGHPTAEDEKLLAQCYRACLSTAVALGARSMAFPCISTGVFGFPQDLAAPIAVETVRAWLDEKPCCRTVDVVFNVFNPRDEELYGQLLGL